MNKEICIDCECVFSNDESGDYCPECGSSNTTEFHLKECQCKTCLKHSNKTGGLNERQ